jgi:hypothetical protein
MNCTVHRDMSPTNSRLRAHGWLVLYWIIFVYATILAGHDPGFVANREAVYPLKDVIFLCVILALLVSLLSFVLQPPTRWPRWSHGLLRVAYVALLFCLLAPCMVTDMPGVVYVPGFFAFATLILLGVRAIPRSDD